MTDTAEGGTGSSGEGDGRDDRGDGGNGGNGGAVGGVPAPDAPRREATGMAPARARQEIPDRGADAARQESPAIVLDAGEREVLEEEIAALAGALRDPEARAAYGTLAAAVSAGEVPAALGRRLETVLELSLGSGRARRMHGAEHEAALRRVFFQTAAGSALRRQAEEVTRALGAMAGQVLAGVAVTAASPGVFRLQLATDRCRLTIEVGRDGVALAQAEVGG